MIFKLNVSTSIRKKDQCNKTFQIMRINVAYNSFLRIYYFYKFASLCNFQFNIFFSSRSSIFISIYFVIKFQFLLFYKGIDELKKNGHGISGKFPKVCSGNLFSVPYIQTICSFLNNLFKIFKPKQYVDSKQRRHLSHI